MTFRIGLVGDLHLSDRAPTMCTDSYNDDLFTMLDEVVRITADRALDAVAFAGDLFHLKPARLTSHRTVQRMIDVIHSFHCPVYLVIGNHDITNDRIESIHETQPFGVLLRAGARLLSGWAEDLPLYGVSWQQDWNSASPAFDDWRERSAAEVLDPDYQGGGFHSLLVTHAPLYPPGQELPWENIPAPAVASWMSNSGYCYYGHVHPCHGTFHSEGVTFCNQGALSRGSLHEEDISRKPAITVWHSDRDAYDAFERVELQSAPPASEVFYLAEAEERFQHQGRLDSFLAALGESRVNLTSVEQVVEHVRSLQELEPDEIALAEEVLMASTHGESK